MTRDKVPKHQKNLSAEQLIERLRLVPPNAIVIVDGIRFFNGVHDVRSTVVWEIDDPVYDTYTTNFLDGEKSYRRGEGKAAVYLNSGTNRVDD